MRRNHSDVIEYSLTTILCGLFVLVLCVGLHAADSDSYGPDKYRTGRVYDTSDDPFMALTSDHKREYGDPFAVYFDEVWHLYTLEGGLRAVRHLTSTDLVHWVEHEPAMTGGGIATGTVLRHDGTYYMFYTLGQGAIGFVTSDNPWHFDKSKTKKVAHPQQEHYRGARVMRDAFVFYIEKEKLWWLIFEAHVGPKTHVALYKAKDLEGPWEPQPPLYTHPQDDHGFHDFVSCPQIFQHGDKWYLTYLSWGTHYHVASAPEGPWGKIKGQYNSDFLTAGSRSASNGKRRLNWGFFTFRPTPENPGAKPRYGGQMGVGREMVFFKDHTIGLRPLPELVAAIRHPEHNANVFAHLKEVSGRWRFDSLTEEVQSLDGKAATALIDLPDDKPDYYFETDVDFNHDTEDVSIIVRTSADGESGYRIALLPKQGIFEITEPAGQQRKYLSEPHQYAKTANVKIFICRGLLEAFVDDTSDLSTRVRVRDRSHSKIMLETPSGAAKFRRPLLHYFRQGVLAGSGIAVAEPSDASHAGDAAMPSGNRTVTPGLTAQTVANEQPAPGKHFQQTIPGYEDAATPPDIRTVEPDLTVPDVGNGEPARGQRVRQTTPGYEDTQAYHTLYLPTDWRADQRYPVIVEYAGNRFRSKYGDVCSGKVDGSQLGYGISAGKGFIWVCMPYLNGDGTANVTTWWGDRGKWQVQPTIDYCIRTVDYVCREYGGDRDAVILAGMSRGAIACNYIGLHDDEIAKLWLAFVVYSHYDGIYRGWPYPDSDRHSALERLKRLKGRAQFICSEGGPPRHTDLADTRRYLEGTRVEAPLTFMETGFRNHNDGWALRPSPAREALRAWLKDVLD